MLFPPDAAEQFLAVVEGQQMKKSPRVSGCKLPKTRRGALQFAETTAKDHVIIAALKEGKNYRKVAAECNVGKSTADASHAVRSHLGRWPGTGNQ